MIKNELQAKINDLINETYELLSNIIKATKSKDENAKKHGKDWPNRHRLHVLLEVAEKARKCYPNKKLYAPWFLTELDATLNLVRNWKKRLNWKEIEPYLINPTHFKHTIQKLNLAGHFEKSGHKVKIIPKSKYKTPDLMVDAIGTPNDFLLVECYQPDILSGEVFTLSNKQANKIIKRLMEKAKKQLSNEIPGLIAICGYNQSKENIELLKQRIEERLQRTDRPNLSGIVLSMMGIMYQKNNNHESFRSISTFIIIINPSYFGNIDIITNSPIKRDDYISVPLIDDTIDDLISNKKKYSPPKRNISSPKRKIKKYEIIKELKIIKKPKDKTRTIFRGIKNKISPFFIGEGIINYICGNCKFLIGQDIWKPSISNVVVECPKCHHYNELPTLPTNNYKIILLKKGTFHITSCINLRRNHQLKGERK